MGQRRIVDGREQRFDDQRLDWVDVNPPVKDAPPMQMNLFVSPPLTDWVIQWTGSQPNVTELKDDFVCGVCGSDVDKITEFKGWMCERIDSSTGEVAQLEEDGIDDVASIRYVCAKSCGWSADESWWLDLNGKGQTVALDIETKEVPPQAPEGVRAPSFDEIQDLFTRLDDIQRGFLRSGTGGSVWPTPWPSGNPDKDIRL